MTVERNSNSKYTSPPIHGQKQKGQQTLPPLPNTLPARVQVKLSDYAPLENPEKALALAMRLKEIQERGEEVLLITRNEELEELNRMSETTTDGEHGEGAITTPLVIPEIDELERRLAGVPEEDGDGKRAVIREWVRGLNGTGSLKPLDEEGKLRRKYTKEVAVEKAQVKDWVLRLSALFKPLENSSTYANKAYEDYNIHTSSISRWLEKQFLKSVGEEGNKVFLEEKTLALIATAHKKFGGHGSSMVQVAIGFYRQMN